MASRTWISSGASNANEPDNWSGSGPILPSDTLVFDGTSVVDCTLTADLGAWSWDNDTGEISGVTLGCAGIRIDAGYTGTIQLSSWKIAIGLEGLNCSAGSGATLHSAVGSAIYLQGQPTTGETPYWPHGAASAVLANADLYFTGRVDLRGTAYTGNSIVDHLYTAVGSYAICAEHVHTDNGGRIFGTVEIPVGRYAQFVGIELMATAHLTGAGKLVWTSSNHPTAIDPAATIDVAEVVQYVYDGSDCRVPAATWGCARYYLYFYLTNRVNPCTVQFEAGTTRFLGDFDITYGCAVEPPAGVVTITVDAATNSSDVFFSGDHVSVIQAFMVGHLDAVFSGSVTLEGSADQVFKPVPDISVEIDKTAGVVTFDGEADITLAGDCGTITELGGLAEYDITPGVDGLTLAAGYSGRFTTTGYDLAIGSSGLDASAAANASIWQNTTGRIAVAGQWLFGVMDRNIYLVDQLIIWDDCTVEFPQNEYSGDYINIAPGVVVTVGDTATHGMAAARITIGNGARVWRPVGRLVSYAAAKLTLGDNVILEGIDPSAYLAVGSIAVGISPTITNLLLYLIGGSAGYSVGPGDYSGFRQFRLAPWGGVNQVYSLDAGDFILPEIELSSYASAGDWSTTLDVTAATSVRCVGDITISRTDAADTASITGTLTLSGTTDQTVDSVSDLALIINKTAGVVTFTGAGDITLAGDSMATGLRIDQTYSGAFSDGGYNVAVAGECVLLCSVGSAAINGAWTLTAPVLSDAVFYGCSLGSTATLAVDGSVLLRTDSACKWHDAIVSAGAYLQASRDSYEGLTGTSSTLSVLGGTLTLRGTIEPEHGGESQPIRIESGTVIIDGCQFDSETTIYAVLGCDVSVIAPATGDYRIQSSYGDWTLSPGDYSTATLRCATSKRYAHTLLAGDFVFSAIDYNVGSGETCPLDAETNSPMVTVLGNITCGGLGTAEIRGNITLGGAADQTLDLSSASTLPSSVTASKPSGVVTIAGAGLTLGTWQSTAINIADGASVDLTGEVILGGVKQTMAGIYAGPQVLNASSAPFQTVIIVGETLSLSMNF